MVQIIYWGILETRRDRPWEHKRDVPILFQSLFQKRLLLENSARKILKSINTFFFYQGFLHFTTSTRSRTLRHLFATLHVRWLSRIFNRNVFVYQTATRWDKDNHKHMTIKISMAAMNLKSLPDFIVLCYETNEIDDLEFYLLYNYSQSR